MGCSVSESLRVRANPSRFQLGTTVNIVHPPPTKKKRKYVLIAMYIPLYTGIRVSILAKRQYGKSIAFWLNYESKT